MADEAKPEERKGLVSRIRSRSMSSSRSRSRSSSRSRDGRPCYRFLMTIQRLSGLPANWNEVSIQHPAEEDPMVLQLSDGVAHIHRGIAFERSFRRSVDRQSDAKFRLIGENGKKFAKIHLDLEQLRQEIDMRDNIIAKIVTFQDDLSLGTIKMEFKLGYFAIDTQSSDSVPAPITSEEPIVFDEVKITTPVGPLGASFANTLIPPTIIRLVPLPDGSMSPLEGKIHPRSELIKFNGIDATLWTLDDFKDHLIASKGDQERTLVFSVPRIPAEEEGADDASKELAAAAVVTPAQEETAQEVQPAAQEEAEVSDDDNDLAKAAAAVGATAVVGAVAVVATSKYDEAQVETSAQVEPEPEPEPEAEAEAEPAPVPEPVVEQATPAAVEPVVEQAAPSPIVEPVVEEAAPAAVTTEPVWDAGYLNNVGYDQAKEEVIDETAVPLPLSITIPNYVINVNHQYVMYDIVCTGLKPDDGKTHRVLRRYKNFEELKVQLESELDGAALPELPSKWSWNALFKRFDEDLVETRRTDLESWLQSTYQLLSESLQNNTLHDFLTAVPEHNQVLNFVSKEKVEVVLKESGDVRLYGQGFDPRTPRLGQPALA